MREFAENYAVNRKKIEEIEKTDLQKSKMVRDLYTEHSYHTDPFDVIYQLLRFGDGRNLEIRIDGTTVYTSDNGHIDSDSQYSFMERYMSKVAPGRMELVGVLVSDPQVPDSDYDGVNDAEDARPTVVNPDLIYILASPHFVNQGKALARVYRSAGLEHLLLNFDGAESFRLNWNSIGLYGGSTLEYGDKYYYNVRNVVISSHGSSECLVLENKKQPQHLWRGGTYQDGSLTVSQLKNKKIHSLNLYACSCGEFRADLSENIAEVFLREKSGIEQVVAFDTTLVGTATRGGKAFSYWGWTYSQAIPLSDSDYDYFISMYGHEGAFYNDSDKFVHDNSDVLGFRCFRRDGSGGYTTINIFNDDIRIGKLYYNTAPDATGNLVTRYFLHEDDLEYDYNQIHDPVLVGY